MRLAVAGCERERQARRAGTGTLRLLGHHRGLASRQHPAGRPARADCSAYIHSRIAAERVKEAYRAGAVVPPDGAARQKRNTTHEVMGISTPAH